MLSQKSFEKLQAFHFRRTVHTNTTPTRACFKNHRFVTIMVIKFELRCVE